MDPVKGIHKNVAIVDFKSMYPSIMISCSNSHDNVDAVAFFGQEIKYDNGNGANNNPKCLSRVVLEDMLRFFFKSANLLIEKILRLVVVAVELYYC